jgi:hypothetical protein
MLRVKYKIKNDLKTEFKAIRKQEGNVNFKLFN